MADILIFIFKYTPFWSVPSMIIGMNFGYLYWLKSLKRASVLMFTIAAFSFILTIIYFWTGGSTNAGPTMIRFLDNFADV